MQILRYAVNRNGRVGKVVYKPNVYTIRHSPAGKRLKP
jgi:hypothetical protein